MNRNDNSEAILSELDDVSFAAHRIHSITWAADQLLTENNDKTLTEAQFRERVSNRCSPMCLNAGSRLDPAVSRRLKAERSSCLVLVDAPATAYTLNRQVVPP